LFLADDYLLHRVLSPVGGIVLFSVLEEPPIIGGLKIVPLYLNLFYCRGSVVSFSVCHIVQTTVRDQNP
jgi:hypothetical protein